MKATAILCRVVTDEVRSQRLVGTPKEYTHVSVKDRYEELATVQVDELTGVILWRGRCFIACFALNAKRKKGTYRETTFTNFAQEVIETGSANSFAVTLVSEAMGAA